MTGAALEVVAREKPETAGGGGDYDILILDASHKHSLTSTRSLARSGLRVALGEAEGQYPPRHDPPAFQSRYCARKLVLPDYIASPAEYVEAVIAFTRDHGVRVVLPVGDANITLLAPHRKRFADLGSMLAVSSDAALEIANDKVRTLELADKLDIAYPRSIPVTGVEDLREAEAQFGYPFVLKPTVSWTGKVPVRMVPTEVLTEPEALEATERFLSTGCEVLAQQFAGGRREGVSLFIVDGEVKAHCGCIAHRTTPPLGGVSAMRESFEVPQELLDAAISLALAIGVEGPSEVEFRRDASGKPLLMEINARLAGTLENAVNSGVDFPMMIWQWGTGQPIEPQKSYRTGVRTRWLAGDMRWLWDGVMAAGRPDSVPLGRGLWTFTSEFFRTRHYDFVDRYDMRPALAEVWDTAAIVRKQWVNRKQWREEQSQQSQG
jgi:glutathione synthase/RimK-type ligase-like ATP-grasp enzyme